MRPDGEVRNILAKAECAIGPSGDVEWLYGVFQDVTEQTRSERLLRDLTDQLPGMAAYWDRDLRCRFANQNYVEWFGRRPEEILGLTLEAVIGRELFQMNKIYIDGAMSGAPQAFERTITKPSGDVGHTYARYIPDHRANGEVMGMYVLVIDVTALKERELRLNASNEKLASARDEALRRADAAAEFLSNMSHEMRTPLTSVLGFTEILAVKGSFGDMERRYVDRIKEASRSLLSIINDVLDFSKLEAGQIDVAESAADPASLASGVLGLFEPQADKKGLVRRFVGESLPPAVMMDVDRVRQILVNFVSNAVKFTSVGDVAVRAAYDGHTGTLRYEVSDTGRGISDAARSKLFKRFSQVDDASTRSAGGSGLGLAISKGLAEAMGGRVGCESQIGRGSTFWVELPCQIPSEDLSNLSEAPNLDRAAGPFRLLVVDDNAAVREIVRLLAEPLGVSVVDAATGAEAAERTQEQTFDAILLDLNMPDMDGSAAALTIRAQNGPNAATPIIAFTAGSVPQAGGSGGAVFDGFLAKPIVTSDLVALLTASRGRPPLLPPEASPPT